MTYILLYAFLYLFAAVVAVLLCQRLGLGSVLGYLLAGIAIGPVLGLVGQETQSIQHIAEFGVVMMLFLVGLELEPQKLWQLRHKLLGLGGLQVVLTVAAITGIAMALGLSWEVGVAVGCILALSSTAIVLQTLGEKGWMGTQGGQSAFSVLLFQDVAAIPMLALLPLLAMGGSHESGGHHAALNLLDGQPHWLKALVTLGVLAVIVFGVRYIVPPVFRYLGKIRTREMFAIFTLGLVVGIAALMSVIGLSPALGTFIAGVALANSAYRHEMESHLEPFKGLLLGLFFITVGAGMNVVLLSREPVLIMGLTVGMMALKAFILLILAKLFRLQSLPGKLFALSLAQAGEFGFVLLSLALQSNLLTAELGDRILLVVALSMVLTPLLFIVYEKILVPRAVSAENEDEREADAIDEENPIIVLGHGRFGQQINSMLTSCGFHTTIIDYHADTVEGLTKYGVKTYYGDATRPEVLTSAGLNHAKLLVVAIDNPKQATEIVEYVHRHYPDLPILARAYDRFHTYDLYHAGAKRIVRETFDSAVRCGRLALEELGFDLQKARELSEFYAKRDRHLVYRMAGAYNPDLPFFSNDEMTDVAREVSAETVEMMRALMRGETVDWKPDEH